MTTTSHGPSPIPQEPGSSPERTEALTRDPDLANLLEARLSAEPSTSYLLLEFRAPGPANNPEGGESTYIAALVDPSGLDLLLFPEDRRAVFALLGPNPHQPGQLRYWLDRAEPVRAIRIPWSKLTHAGVLIEATLTSGMRISLPIPELPGADRLRWTASQVSNYRAAENLVAEG